METQKIILTHVNTGIILTERASEKAYRHDWEEEEIWFPAQEYCKNNIITCTFVDIQMVVLGTEHE